MVRFDISLVTEQSFRLHFTYTLTSTKYSQHQPWALMRHVTDISTGSVSQFHISGTKLYGHLHQQEKELSQQFVNWALLKMTTGPMQFDSRANNKIRCATVIILISSVTNAASVTVTRIIRDSGTTAKWPVWCNERNVLYSILSVPLRAILTYYCQLVL